MRYHFKKGFTLVELVIVLFIVGLAMSVAVASLGNAYKKNVLRQEVIRLQNTLRHARELSLIQKTPFALTVDEENGMYWLEKNNAIYGNSRKMPQSISMIGERIIFLPKGNSTGGSVTLQDNKKRGYFIEVDPVTGTAKARRL